MINTSHRRALGAAAFIAVIALAGTAGAQGVDTVTVSWVPVAAVPISPWAMAGIALAIVALGFGFMRGKGFARYTAYGLGAVLIGVSALAPRPALAVKISPPQSITTTTGTLTYQVTGTCGYSNTTITNNAGAAVKFTVISDDGASQNSVIDNAHTTCAVGSPLAPAGTCVIITSNFC